MPEIAGTRDQRVLANGKPCFPPGSGDSMLADQFLQILPIRSRKRGRPSAASLVFHDNSTCPSTRASGLFPQAATKQQPLDFHGRNPQFTKRIEVGQIGLKKRSLGTQ